MAEKEEILLTVVIPVYNRAEYIGKCVDSVRNQAYRNLEIILVDDGSTDGSGERCDGYARSDARITVIHRENGGQNLARKSGVEKASGEVVAFVDSDDWISPDMYECMVSAYMDGKPDMVTSGIIWEYGEWQKVRLDGIEDGVYEKDSIRHKIFPCLIYDEKMGSQGISASLCGKLWKTSLLKKILDTVDTQMKWGEDGAVVYAFAAQADKITVLHHAWYHYVQHADSMIRTYDSSSFEKIYRLKSSLAHTFAGLDVKAKREMKRQIDWYVRGFLGAAVKKVFEMDMDHFSWVFPYEHVPMGSRVILYGAGDVGRSYWNCLRQGEYAELIAWVDRRHTELQEAGLPVESIDSALCKEYDYMVIAVREKELAERIRGFLVEYGVREDRVIWKQNLEGGGFW